MNILYVFPEPLPLPRARGIQTVNTVAALVAQGGHVRLAHVPAPDGREPFAAYGISRPPGLETLLSSRSLPYPLQRLPVRSNRLFVMRLARLLSRSPPDIVMARHVKAAYTIRRRFPRLPLLYEAHEVFADTASQTKRRRVEAMEGFVVADATVLVSQSEATARGLRARYGIERPIHVVRNGVNVRTHLPDKLWDQAGQHVIYTGNLFGWKGADVLVEAARWLAGVTIRLYGGDHSDVVKLRGQVPQGGACVVVAGRISQQEVLERLTGSCIAVLPNIDTPDSRWTSPLKLFEYMAAGCAIVASDLPAMREVLGEDEAVWVQPGDPRSMAEGIRRLTSDPQQARTLGIRVWRKSKRFSWERRAQTLLTLMEQAVLG